MSKSRINKIELFISIFLLLLAAWCYSCSDGPCKNLNDGCGDIGGGQGTCQEVEGDCVGLCPSYCPKGAPDQYCKKTSGECEWYMTNCTRIVTYNCVHSASGCTCAEMGTGNYCSRQGC